MAKKKRRDYSKIKFDDLPQKMEPERRVINSRIAIDYSIFKKTPEEKLKLKKAKLKHQNNV